MENIYVRTATIDDIDTLVSFALSEAIEAENSVKSPDSVRDGVRVAIENTEIARYWVLETSEKQIIGEISVYREWSDWHAGYYWWIQSMYISPEYRGKMLMQVLINEVYRVAEKEHALELRLYVHNDNIRAIKAYQRDGFSISPYKMMAMKVHNLEGG